MLLVLRVQLPPSLPLVVLKLLVLVALLVAVVVLLLLVLPLRHGRSSDEGATPTAAHGNASSSAPPGRARAATMGPGDV
jgi:hypothetical protein